MSTSKEAGLCQGRSPGSVRACPRPGVRCRVLPGGVRSPGTAYLLIYRGRSYDSKAIAGLAHKFATGVPLNSHDFNGGIYGAARVLRRLGFEVRNVRDPTGSE